MYRDLKASSAGWVRKKSYCNTVGCVARGGWSKEKIVLQKNCIVTKGQAVGVSCDTARSSAHDTALAHTTLGHDTAVEPATRVGQGAQGRAARRAAQRAGASGTMPAIRRWGARTRQPEAAIRPSSPTTIRRWAGHDTDARARLGAPSVLVGLVGGSCSQFGF